MEAGIFRKDSMAVKGKKALEKIPGYVPARSINSIQEAYGQKRIIKLAANENNLGCSPAVAKALAKEADQLSRYPDYANTRLLERLTVLHGVTDQELIFTDGSFELISIIAQVYLNPGEESVTADPSFGWYENVTKQNGASMVKVPLKDNQTDLDGLLQAITEKTKIIWLCNPNNPVGSMVDHGQIYQFLKKVPDRILVVLDEAYIDFASEGHTVDSVSLIHEFNHVIALRTFSKLYGLAGLRLGYGIANAEIIEKLYTVKQPFNVNMAAQIAAAASLDDKEFQEKVKKNNREGLQLYYQTLDRLGLEYVRSNGNFILFRTGIDSDLVVLRYLEQGILLRGGKEFGRPDWIRITIGTPEENRLVLKILEKIITENQTQRQEGADGI